MAKRKSFGAYVPGGPSPIEVEINGVEFKFRGAMSGIRLLNMLKALDGDDNIDSATTMVDFITQSALTEERDRLLTHLENEDNPVPLSLLTEIIRYLIEEYSAKPTEPSPSSPDGSKSTGATNTESPFSTESTSVNSTDVPSLPLS